MFLNTNLLFQTRIRIFKSQIQKHKYAFRNTNPVFKTEIRILRIRLNIRQIRVSKRKFAFSNTNPIFENFNEYSKSDFYNKDLPFKKQICIIHFALFAFSKSEFVFVITRICFFKTRICYEISRISKHKFQFQNTNLNNTNLLFRKHGFVLTNANLRFDCFVIRVLK